jgi:hypothetical protein
LGTTFTSFLNLDVEVHRQATCKLSVSAMSDNPARTRMLPSGLANS